MKINISIFCLSFLLISCSLWNENAESEKLKEHTTVANAAYIISARTLSFDENEMTELDHHGQILQIVGKDEDLSTIQKQWNKRFYENLLHHYQPSIEELKMLAGLFQSVASTDYAVQEAWPEKLSDQQFDKIFDFIGQDLIVTRPFSDSLKNKYAIVVNPNFWTYTTDFDYPLLVDIISTYECQFDNYELYHDDRISAFYYGTIIFDRLCSSRNPDNPHHYTRLLIEQFDSLSPQLQAELKAFDLSEDNGLAHYNLPARRTMDDYQQIIEKSKQDLEKAIKVFTSIPNPPFFVVRL